MPGRNLFYALTAYANPQLTTPGCMTTVHYLRARLFWNCSLCLGLQIRVKRGQRHQDAIGPAEADLRRIFAAAALVAAGRSDIVFLDELRVTPVAGDVLVHPACGDFVRQSVEAVVAQADDRDPLQRRPAVGRVPLLAALDERRGKAAHVQQFSVLLLPRPPAPVPLSRSEEKADTALPR